MADEARAEPPTKDPYDLLNQWLEGPPKRRQEDVAREIQVSQQYVSALKNRRAVPSPLVRVRLKFAAGIPVNLWPDTPPMTAAEENELEAASQSRPDTTSQAPEPDPA